MPYRNFEVIFYNLKRYCNVIDTFLVKMHWANEKSFTIKFTEVGTSTWDSYCFSQLLILLSTELIYFQFFKTFYRAGNCESSKLNNCEMNFFNNFYTLPNF